MSYYETRPVYAITRWVFIVLVPLVLLGIFLSSFYDQYQDNDGEATPGTTTITQTVVPSSTINQPEQENEQ